MTNDALSTYLGIATASSEGSVLRLLIELAAQFVGAEEGSLLVLDEANKELVFAMTVGSEMSAEVLAGQRIPLGKGLTGLAAATHEVQVGAPSFKDVRQAEKRQGIAAGEPSAVLAAPMLIGDALVGVITAVSFRPEKRFNSDDARLYGRIATVAGVVVDQARRLQVIERLREGEPVPTPLTAHERSRQAIVESLSRLVQTSPHKVDRVAQLVLVIEELCT